VVTLGDDVNAISFAEEGDITPDFRLGATLAARDSLARTL
jgi:hypothetical protein